LGDFSAPVRLSGRKTLKKARCKTDVSVMTQQVLQSMKAREHLRLRMVLNDPVYLVTAVQNIRLDLPADDLGGGGARLTLPLHHEDSFKVDDALGPSMLVLPEIGLPVVNPVVRWKSDAAMGVEFIGITEKQRELIYKFLFRVERLTVRHLVL
jgi:hypothetical protein